MQLSTTSSILVGVGLVLACFSFALFSAYDTNGNTDNAISVAFVGNSFTFVNDLPRVMEALSEGKIERQDSCLHGGLTVTSLLQKGNGMYNHWGNPTHSDDAFPDFGACTVLQMFLGYDEALVKNYEDYYTDDGLNPCFQDTEYLNYSTAIRSREKNQNNDDKIDDGLSAISSLSRWDYVVINDQSMYPAVYEKRIKSASTLWEEYGPMLNSTESIPILYQTWAYWRADINMTGFVDVPTFTRLLKEGYEYYAAILEKALPNHLKPEIAPVGLAFLVIWEENFSFWKRLFGEDLYHPSPHGTYLAGCVIYTTINKRLPSASSRFTTEVFSRSRKMQLSGERQALPTEDEALYLRWIAKRVAIQGHVPKSLDRKINE